jgi:hypothetical protein
MTKTEQMRLVRLREKQTPFWVGSRIGRYARRSISSMVCNPIEADAR